MALLQNTAKCIRPHILLCNRVKNLPVAGKLSSRWILSQFVQRSSHCPTNCTTCCTPMSHPCRRSDTTTCTAAREASTATSPHRTSFSHGITYINYEVNTFVIKFNSTGARVLVDPWLVGNLVFPTKGQAVGRALKVDVGQVASETDVVVLTQASEDHTHLPTLRLLPKSLPVVAAYPGAAATLQDLGFSNVSEMGEEQEIMVCNGKLRIRATKASAAAGVSLRAPTPSAQQPAGLMLTEVVDTPSFPAIIGGERFMGASLLLSPHLEVDPAAVEGVGKVDVLVSPINTAPAQETDSGTPNPPPSQPSLVKLLKVVQPQVLVPLLNPEVDHEGTMGVGMQGKTDIWGVQAQLEAAGLEHVRVEFPAPPGESVAIAL